MNDCFRSKFKARRTNCGLHSHMSRAEAECCCFLQLMERSNQLKILKIQPNVHFPQIPKKIIPDWLLQYPDGQRYADYKGFETQSWKLNRKIWKLHGPLPLEVWKHSGNRFFIIETIQGAIK